MRNEIELAIITNSDLLFAKASEYASLVNWNTCRQTIESLCPARLFECAAQIWMIDYRRSQPRPDHSNGMVEMQRAQFVWLAVVDDGDVIMAVLAARHGALDVLEYNFRDLQFWRSLERARDEFNRRNQIRQTQLETAKRFSGLTRREMEIMNMIVDGKPNRDIARTINRSLRTVEVHRANILRKLGTGSVQELVRLVLALPQDPPVAAK